ncbi:hypothetical protein [Comamonas testosteroni]|uniref:hypothetical protein n=1 Tax=Comamonas testosteroni TaxID=285 RepID=UPI0015FBBE7D|nr:hypothetical protein [Comamonas testosteroni]
MSQNSSPDNVPGAKQGTADSLAAPGCVGAGGTNEPRNKAAWLSISDFLTRQNLGLVLQARQRSVAAGVAGAAQAASAAQGASHFIPVGNHGEIVGMGVGL